MPPSDGTFTLSSQGTSPSLLERAKSRDADAWSRLSQLYTPLVYRWARQAGLQASDAADVVQEVFRSVAGKLEEFREDGENSTFRGWLWVITRNQVRLHFRKASNRPEATGGTDAQQQLEQLPDMLDADHEPADFDAGQSLVHRAVRLIRDDFEKRTWKAFWRTTVEGQSAAEVGEDLGMNQAAVRQAKYRVLTRLRQELEGS